MKVKLNSAGKVLEQSDTLIEWLFFNAKKLFLLHGLLLIGTTLRTGKTSVIIDIGYECRFVAVREFGAVQLCAIYD